MISAGLELFLLHTEKSCIASYYRRFSTNIKIKLIKFKPVLLVFAFGADKTGFNLIIFHFYKQEAVYNTMRKVSILKWRRKNKLGETRSNILRGIEILKIKWYIENIYKNEIMGNGARRERIGLFITQQLNKNVGLTTFGTFIKFWLVGWSSCVSKRLNH